MRAIFIRLAQHGRGAILCHYTRAALPLWAVPPRAVQGTLRLPTAPLTARVPPASGGSAALGGSGCFLVFLFGGVSRVACVFRFRALSRSVRVCLGFGCGFRFGSLPFPFRCCPSSVAFSGGSSLGSVVFFRGCAFVAFRGCFVFPPVGFGRSFLRSSLACLSPCLPFGSLPGFVFPASCSGFLGFRFFLGAVPSFFLL